MTEPLSSNPLLSRLHRYADSEPKDRGGRILCGEAADEIERLTREIDDRRHLTSGLIDQKDAEIERLRHELDNERSAMRNVQECAESYRRERDEWKETAGKRLTTIYELRAYIDRLRGLLQEAAHVIIEHECVDVSIDWIDGWAARYRAAVETEGSL